MLYFDCAASAPVFPDLLLDEEAELCAANASSKHQAGRAARQLIEQERSQLAGLFAVAPDQITFCGGATEANQLAIYNTLFPALLQSGGGETLRALAFSSPLDHPSVTRPLQLLETAGLFHQRIRVTEDGRLQLGKTIQRYTEKHALPSKTLCCISALDSETGRQQDLYEIGDSVSQWRSELHLHTDLVQYLSTLDLQSAPQIGELLRDRFDSLSLNAHKLGGPKGFGILLQRKPSRWSLSQGGGQEGGQRSGTENTAAIAAGCRAIARSLRTYPERRRAAEMFYQTLTDYPDLFLEPAGRRTQPDLFSPFIATLAVPPLPAEVLQRLLAEQQIAVGTGSACTGNSPKKIEKFLRQGYDRKRIPSLIRLSFATGNSRPSAADFHSLFQTLKTLRRKYS